ncbi:MAG TPA: ABC transporter permease [Solirubrobacterales bacterium]|nr:ABC transporter permease [Solirubrobacterales bacterium]
MIAYVLRRFLQAIPVLFGITLAAFFLIQLVPGDPARIVLGAQATPSAVATLNAQLGLDQPLFQQYLDFVTGALTLDFGESITQKTSIGPLLGERIPVTFFLLLYSVAIAIVVAVPLAVISALRRNRAADHGIRLFSMVTFAMPSFLLGLLLILAFSLNLGWLPTSGYGEGFVGHLRSLTLPAITVGLYLAPILLRTLRVGIIETLGAEYVEAARARGISERRVVLKHVLRNSLVSTVTVLGLNIGFLLSGLVIIENVFALPGLGSELVSSVVNRDYPTVQALALLFGVAVVAINLATDLLYAALDPRVRL